MDINESFPILDRHTSTIQKTDSESKDQLEGHQKRLSDSKIKAAIFITLHRSQYKRFLDMSCKLSVQQQRTRVLLQENQRLRSCEDQLASLRLKMRQTGDQGKMLEQRQQQLAQEEQPVADKIASGSEPLEGHTLSMGSLSVKKLEDDLIQQQARLELIRKEFMGEKEQYRLSATHHEAHLVDLQQQVYKERCLQERISQKITEDDIELA